MYDKNTTQKMHKQNTVKSDKKLHYNVTTIGIVIHFRYVVTVYLYRIAISRLPEIM